MWLIGFSLDGLIAFDCGQVDRFVVLFGVSVVCLRFTVGFWVCGWIALCGLFSCG